MRILSCWDVGDEASLLTVEVNEHKGGGHKDADDAIATECRFRAEVGDE